MRIGSTSVTSQAGGYGSGQSSAAGGISAAASTPGSVLDDVPSDLETLAAALGVSSGKLSSLITSGGKLTVTAGGAARLAGLPLAADGTPDFDAIRAAGGTVQGAIPPDGNAKLTWVDGDHQTTYVAAEVTMPGGQPVYVKSLNMQAPRGDDVAKGNLAQVRTALHYYNKLPNNWAEAQKRLGDGENFFDAVAGSSIDLHL
jgi:hypothetical protein